MNKAFSLVVLCFMILLGCPPLMAAGDGDPFLDLRHWTTVDSQVNKYLPDDNMLQIRADRDFHYPSFSVSNPAGWDWRQTNPVFTLHNLAGKKELSFAVHLYSLAADGKTEVIASAFVDDGVDAGKTRTWEIAVSALTQPDMGISGVPATLEGAAALPVYLCR